MTAGNVRISKHTEPMPLRFLSVPGQSYNLKPPTIITSENCAGSLPARGVANRVTRPCVDQGHDFAAKGGLRLLRAVVA